MQERIKVKALSEELENPNNKHRWRKLEGSDPGTYEMLQKIQALQKRLILKTEEVVEKDLLIQEKDKLYVELKNILARQPGPEARRRLNLRLPATFPAVKTALSHREGGRATFDLPARAARQDEVDEGDGVGAQHVSGAGQRIQV